MRFPILLAAAVGLFLTGLAAAQDHDAMVARGKYLVESVSMCQDCHTPKTESGAMDKSKWLKGGALNISAIQPVAKWHKTAPDLTSSGRLFKRWGVEGLVKFLETGNGPTGHPADPPMPAYRLSHEDAVAVVEYLKTLP